MRLNYNDMLLLAIWEYNRRQDEDLTLEVFQETFGQVLGAHFHDINPEKPDVPLNKNDAFQKVQKTTRTRKKVSAVLFSMIKAHRFSFT